MVLVLVTVVVVSFIELMNTFVSRRIYTLHLYQYWITQQGCHHPRFKKYVLKAGSASLVFFLILKLDQVKK
jgi:uncharacterized membrane protein